MIQGFNSASTRSEGIQETGPREFTDVFHSRQRWREDLGTKYIVKLVPHHELDDDASDCEPQDDEEYDFDEEEGR